MAFSAVRAKYTKLENYFVEALALDDKALTALRRKFLIDESAAAARAALGRCPTKSSSAGNGPGQPG